MFYKCIPRKHAEKVRSECRQFDGYRSYPIHGVAVEPRVHALLTSKPGRVYAYGGTKMKGEYIHQQKYSTFSTIFKDSCRELCVDDFKIGMNLICYRDGNDSIGWHQDNNQQEDSILTISLGPIRPVMVSTGKGKGEAPADGDEDIELWIGDGDAYCMDKSMQETYYHSLPKRKKILEPRYALVLRDGEERISSDDEFDNGDVVVSLKPQPKGKNIHGHVPGQNEGDLYVRKEMFDTGGHRHFEGGVGGTATDGACSLVVSKSGDNQRDGLEWLTYSSTRKQGACATFKSMKDKMPIRVYRSDALSSEYSPRRSGSTTTYRYDGIYYACAAFQKDGTIASSEPEIGSEDKYTFILFRAEPGHSIGRDSSAITAEALRAKILVQTRRTELPKVPAPPPHDIFNTQLTHADSIENVTCVAI